ncbi:MAG: DMT family transporter [Candidatus Lokiarchaeota archaeon]|nr:DMT family transporter [Candidatus Lokiarchaeota archaeon]
MPRFKPTTYLFVFVAIGLFSPVFLFSKYVLPPLTPFSYMFLRSAFGTAFLTVVLLSRKLFGSFVSLLKDCWRDVLLFSLAFHLLPLVLVFFSTPITTPTDQVIINNMNLAFVLIINKFAFRAKMMRRMIIAVGINFAGALLVLWPLDFSQNPNLLGDVIMILAVIIGSFFYIWNKKLAFRADPAVLNFSVNFFPTIVSLPLMFFIGGAGNILELSGAGWFFITFIGIGISGIAYCCLNEGYRDPAMSPEHMSMFTTLIPVVGLGLSIAAGFGTGWVNYLGAGLVIFSIVIANFTSSREKGVDAVPTGGAIVVEEIKKGDAPPT